MKRWRCGHSLPSKNLLSYPDAHNPPLLISHCVQSGWEWRCSPLLCWGEQGESIKKRKRESGGGGGGERERQQCALHSAGHLSAVKAITAPPSVKCLKCALACNTVASCPSDAVMLWCWRSETAPAPTQIAADSALLKSMCRSFALTV